MILQKWLMPLHCLFVAGFAISALQPAMAAPIAPSTLPTHLWLFDEATSGTGGTGTPDAFSNLALYGATLGSEPTTSRRPVLVETGSVIRAWGSAAVTTASVASGTPLNYAGNKSVLNDWSGSGTYPNASTSAQPYSPRQTTGELNGTASLAIGTSGAISFWYNPLWHDGTNATEQYLFALQSADGSATFTANGRGTGDIKMESASTLVAAGTASYGFSYGDAANSMPGTNWYHLSYSWSPSNSIQVFMNGALLATGFGDVAAFTATNIRIGSYHNAATHAPGLYDEFAIWDAPLTLENAQWLYVNSLNDFNPIPEPATAGMFVAGLIGLNVFWRKRKSA